MKPINYYFDDEDDDYALINEINYNKRMASLKQPKTTTTTQSNGFDIGSIFQFGLNTMGTIGGNLWDSATRLAKQPKAFMEKGIDLNDIPGTLGRLYTTTNATAFDAGKFFVQGAMGTLESTADTLQYLSSDTAKNYSQLGELLFGKNIVSDVYAKYGDWVKKNAQFDSTGALVGNDAENSLFEGLMWSKGQTAKKLGLNKTAEVFDKLGKVDNEGKTLTQRATDYSALGQTGEQVFEGLGNIAMMAAEGAVLGSAVGAVPGMTTAGQTGAVEFTKLGKLVQSGIPSFMSGYGNARSKAYEDGASDEEARKYATINGLAEAISEQFFDAMPGIKSAGFAEKLTLKNMLGDRLEKSFGSNVGRLFLKFVGGLEEGSEEVISNLLVTLGSELLMQDQNYQYNPDNLTGNAVEDLKNTFLSQESWDAFFSAMLSSALLGGGEFVKDTARRNQLTSAYAKDNGITYKEAKNLLFNQMQEATKENMSRENYESNVDFNKSAENRVLNFVENTSNVEEQVNKQLELREADYLKNHPGEEITDDIREQLRTQIRESFVDRVNNPDKYTAFKQETKNERDKTLAESMQTSGMTNTKLNHDIYNFVKTLQDNNEKSQYKFVSRQQIMDLIPGSEEKFKNGVFPRAFKMGDTIYVNSQLSSKDITTDSQKVKYYEALIGHEMGEAIKASDKASYDDLKSIVKELYDFKESDLDSYKALYGDNLTDDVEDEWTNDKLGDLFENEQMINKIADNRNLLQKVIDEIKKFVKYITSGKEQKQFMQLQEKLENKYAELYKEADFNKGSENTSFSLTQENELNDYLENNKFTLDNNGSMNFENLTTKQINTLTSIYRKTGYDDVSPEYLKGKLSETNGLKVPREVADRFIEKELGYKPKIDTTKVFEDAEGNKLTQEQVDFFKDSDVRDIRGRLIPVYHRTNADFTIFDNKAGKQHGNKYGKGFYFSITPENYGNNTMKLYLNAKEGEYKYIQDKGYYIVQEPNMVKNIDNTNPTSNPDIRYSLSVEQANTGTDNTGRELSNEQKEYFKNSKATDEKGNLIEVFHTTTEYTHQFNEFNPVGTPLYRYGNTAVNFFTDSQEMSNSYGYNMVTPDTTRIESMEDLSKQLGDRYRVEENNGKYELFDSNDEKQLDSYKDLMKIFNQEEQDILNKTFNKSRSEVRELLNNDEEQFDFYDKTRTKFLNMLSHYNKFKGLDLTGTNMTIDKIVDNYLRNEKLEPITTFNSQEDLFKNAIKYVSPYEHYQYNGYVNITNPYIVDAKGTNWNKIQVENIDELKQQIKDKWDVPERQLDKLEGDTLKELNKDLTKLGYQIRPDDLGDLGIFTKDSQLAIDVINVNDVMQEIREDLDSDLKTPISTNDIVFQALAENEAGANYDGVIIQNVIDYGENSRNPDIPNNVYVTFDSNQFKAADNLNPTSNKDIRYSLSADGLKNLANELGESYSMLESNLTGRDRAGIKRYLENYTGIVDKYLADNNINVEPAYRDIEFTRVGTPELQQFVRDNDLTIEKLANDKELQDKYFDLWFGDSNEERFTKQWRDLLDFVKENPREDEIPRPLRAIQREMQQIRDGETQEIDESATKSKKLDAAIDNGYDFWIEDQITPLFEKIDYDVDEVMEEAKANHGTTDDYNVGAYMTTDGNLLDFDDGGYRDDHRTISVFNLDMNEFMDYGAIRMKPEANGFEMAVEPTTEQYSRLEDYIDNYLKTNAGVHSDNSTIWVDFDIPGTNNYNSASYNINTPTSKIINDIKEYWRTGELPKQSEYADFYYSLSKDNQQNANLPTILDTQFNNQGIYNLPTATQENEELPFFETEEPVEEDRFAEQRRKLADKRIRNMIEKQTYKSAKAATKVAKDYVGFDSNETKEFREGIENLANKRKDVLIKAKNYQQVKDLVSKFANRENTFVSEELKEAQKDVRHSQLIVSPDLRSQITDWTDFRKKSGLNIKSGQKSNVDVVYQELLDSYPGMLDSTITNYADQLQAMSEFVHRDNKIIERYTLDDNTINQITNRVWEKLSQNALTKQDFKAIEDDINKQVERRTREVVQNALLEDMGITLDDIDVGKDISSIAYQRTDPKRLNEKVFGYDIGQKINDATTNFVGHQEAERTRFLNQERSDIQKLGIKARSKESAAVQKYGEKQYVNDKGEVVEYNDKDLMREFPKYEDQQRIKKAASVLRAKYDEYIDRINESLVEMGYDPIPKRQDYFKHFTELDDKLSQWGIPYSRENLNAEELSTDINGLTDQFKPGKNFFASALQRKGIKTTYDAITGIDKYLEGASNLMYHTESIQRYRTLSKFIRNTYGQTHGLEDLDTMTPEEAQKRVEDVYNNKLTRYAAWLDEQANSLAGKKGAIDRSMERFMGRKAYTFLGALKSQVGSNMTGFNVRSAMTNFASAIQGASKTNKLAMLEGSAFALKNYINEDTDLINKSDFLTRRFGSDALSKKAWQKISNAGQVFMSATDRFTSLQIWGGKYYEGLHKGLTQEAAIKQADDFAARIMGDRSKGQTAEIFNSKTLGLLTQFQLEVNNQWSSMIHDNRMEMQKNPGLKTSMKIVSQLGQLYAASYFFNNFMKALTGSDVMFDPIDILKGIIAPPDDDDKTLEERATEALGKLINQIPMASIFTGGRIPISEAFTGVGTLGKKLTGQKDAFGNEITWDDVKDDLIASSFYFLLPTGYGQIKKTAQGLGQYGQVLPEPIEKAMDIYHNENLPVAGNYTKAGKLKYEADETPYGKIQSALFGRNASEAAQEYREKGYQPLSEKNVKTAVNANLPISEYREIKQGITDAANAVKGTDISSTEAKADYIYNLPLNTTQKDALIKDSTTRKEPIDMKEYGNYGSLDEYDYATQHNDKYITITQITDYDTYQTYKDEIKAIKEIYSNSQEKKREVQAYINSLGLNIYQKLMLEKMAGGYSIKNYKGYVQSYINSLDLTKEEKEVIDNELFG